MGIVQSSNTLFLNVSKGFLVNKKKDISCYAYNGLLKEVTFKDDTYEGKPTLKLCLKLVDDKQETAIIEANARSWFAIGFFQRMGRIDPFKNVTIGVSGSDKSEKVSFCWVKQGEAIKVEKKENDPLIPKKQVIEGNEITLWETPLALYKQMAQKYNEKAAAFIPAEEPTINPDVPDDLSWLEKDSQPANTTKAPF